MPKPVQLLLLCSFTVTFSPSGISRLNGQTPQIPAEVRQVCTADVQQLCANVQPGGGRLLACLKQHQDQVSTGCKQAIYNALQKSGGQTNVPAAPASSTSAERHDTGPSNAAPQVAGAPDVKGHFFLMKQVQIIDQSMGGKPAYDMLIPATWQFRGWVATGKAEGGCFADMFPAVAQATSPDNSIDFQMLPQYTWQYADDPSVQRQMEQHNQQNARVGMKPCPVKAPVPAAEFLRQEILPKYLKDKTVVSVDPFPELNQMVRHRLGLSPVAGTASDTNGIRTDAARARVLSQDDKGQPVEIWVTSAMVVRTIPGSGRGSFYDWHALNVMFFRAPKGHLDANDKLFKLIISTIHPELQWQKQSNAMISTLYQKQQEEWAKQSQMIAQFQRHVAETINGVVANSMAGANHAAFTEDQTIRGVQTYRDPSTGATYELSNQFDHAWLNGLNQYVMSDDPSFNPNGQLSGNWTELQVVR